MEMFTKSPEMYHLTYLRDQWVQRRITNRENCMRAHPCEDYLHYRRSLKAAGGKDYFLGTAI